MLVECFQYSLFNLFMTFSLQSICRNISISSTEEAKLVKFDNKKIKKEKKRKKNRKEKKLFVYPTTSFSREWQISTF